MKTKVIRIAYYKDGYTEKLVKLSDGKLVVYPGGGR